MIYCAQAGAIGFKVGHTAGDDPNERIRGLQIGCPLPIELRWSMPGNERIESRIHRFLSPHRMQGEWFSLASLAAADRISTDNEFFRFVVRLAECKTWIRDRVVRISEAATISEFIIASACLPSEDLHALINVAENMPHYRPQNSLETKETLSFSVPVGTKKVVRRMAKQQKMTQSAFIRRALFHALGLSDTLLERGRPRKNGATP